MSGVTPDAPASHKPNQHHDEEHEEHVNHEAWVIPYADMLTLLMALFLMMWATSTQDEAKFAALAESLHEALGQGVGVQQAAVTDGSEGILEGQTAGVTGGDDSDPATDPEAAVEALAKQQKAESAAAAESKTLEEVRQRIAEGAAENNLASSVQFRTEERGLVVSIVSDSVLFDAGSTTLKPQGENILRVVGNSLNGAPNNIQVEGHTDNSPINTSRFPSNWELSALRGTSVLRFMVEGAGFNPDHIASGGYGDRRPVASNDTAEGRAANRRVELVILRSDAPLESQTAG